MLGAERPTFWRESRHYSIFAYLLGKNIAQLPLTAAYPFFYTLFTYQMLRPYGPFQSFYLIFLLMQWVGEGMGQFISLQFNSSRQLAGGVAALICTVLTGSFPLLSTLGDFFNVITMLSFCRWGMVAMLSVEFAPWYMGDPTTHGQPGCCALPDDVKTKIQSGQLHDVRLPVECERTVFSTVGANATHKYPSSRPFAALALNDTYRYDAWFPTSIVHKSDGSVQSPAHLGIPDLYPLPESSIVMDGHFDAGNSGISSSAFAAMIMLGLFFRVLCYISLRCIDRSRRR